MARLGRCLSMVFDGANRPQGGRFRPSKTMVDKGRSAATQSLVRAGAKLKERAVRRV